MATIIDFNTLSGADRKQFAIDLLNKINAENTFTADADFAIESPDNDIWADVSGNLMLDVYLDKIVIGSAEATWVAYDRDDLYDLHELEYESVEFDDIFKTYEAIIDDYKVSFTLYEYDVEDIEDCEVEDYSYEDAGIGHYEYWGYQGYDSSPYIEVSGVIFPACHVMGTLEIEPLGTN